MSRIIEIRSYNLKPGTRAEFNRIATDVVRPMLVAHGMDVVAAKPSLVEENSYFLIRAYADAADRAASQDSFYGGAAWKEGPRASIIACIESYATIVIEAEEATIDGLRDRPRA
jgi:hypothetical protein